MNTQKPFFRQMLKNFNGHVLPEGDKHTNLGLIHLIVFTTSLIGGTVMYFYDTNSCLSLLLLGFVSFLGWLVNRAGHPRSSAVILIAALLITIQFNVFSGFGIHDVSIIAWPALIFFSGLLFGWQAIPYMTALIMLLAVVTNLIPNSQFISNYSDTGDLIVMLLILLAFSLIAMSLLRRNEHLLQHSQHSDERFQAIYNSIDDAIIIYDAQTGFILDFNQKTSEMFGYSRQESALLDAYTISSGIAPYTQENALALIKKVTTQGAQNFEWQVKDKSGRLFWVDVNMQLASIAGQAQVLVSARDITERKQVEAKILAALEEKETLLREVHHRVKNNLQAIISLIEMQAGLIPDEAIRQFLQELEGQARTMALVYEQLYQSVNLARVQMAPYLQQLTYYISETFGDRRRVQLSLDAGSVSLDVAQAMPCGLIVNELFTNIFKHAFPPGFDGQPLVHIVLQLDGESYHLTVADNGVGLPPGHDWQTSRSLGLRLVNLWATHQLGGTLNVNGDPGVTYCITFPNPQGVLC